MHTISSQLYSFLTYDEYDPNVETKIEDLGRPFPPSFAQEIVNY